MINANQITDKTTEQNLTSFLKSTSAGQFHLLNLEQVQILELAINDAYAVPLQPNQRRRTDVQEMLKKRKRQIERPVFEKQLQQIQQKKKELQNWKLIYIMALFGILAYIAKPSTNKKTSEQYQFDSTGKQNGITKIQEIIHSGWSWLWIGIVAIVVIIISLCAFIDTEVVCCEIKLKGVIPISLKKEKEF